MRRKDKRFSLRSIHGVVEQELQDLQKLKISLFKRNIKNIFFKK